MPELWFDPHANAAVTALEQDVTRKPLLERVEAALKALATDSGDARCRRRSYAGVGEGMWGMPVRSQDHEWLILWRQGPTADDVTVVYVGPDL